MRLLLDVSAVPERPVGAGVYTVQLVRGLADHDELDLHLLARRDDATRWANDAPKATVHPEVPERRPARLLWEQLRAPALADRLGIDVWHGPHYTMPARLDVPAVVTVHDLTFFDHPEWHERSKVAFFTRMLRVSAHRARALIAVSEHTAGRLRARLDPRAPIVVAPHGVDHERFRPAPRGDTGDLDQLRHLGVQPPYLAFAGTLEPRKDLPSLIAAFARIAPTRPDLRLVLAGRDGWGATAVRDAAAESGVTTRILRAGWFPGPALAAFYRQSEAVAYPSLEEGFGLPALEALACGAALVTTTGSAMEEVAGHAARLVAPGNVDTLAATLADVLDDADLATKLRHAGPSQAAPFTWEHSIDRHLHAYRLAAGVHAPRAAVTGARGFVGPHLVDHLEACGDEVLPLDRHGPDSFDVTDAAAVHERLAAARPEVVYHLAALSHVGESWKSPATSFRVNAEGTLNVLRTCTEFEVDRVIVVLSSEEYGRVEEADLPLTEDAPLRPVTPYGAAKAAADLLTLQAFLGDGLGAIRVRPFSHTGPGQSSRFVVPALAARIARAERDGIEQIPVGSLDVVRDLTDVRDVVRAYRLVARHGEPGEVYNVCSGTGVSVQEIADRLLAREKRPIRLVTDPELVRPVEVPRLVGSSARLQKATGWAPEIPLATTLADVLEDARSSL